MVSKTARKINQDCVIRLIPGIRRGLKLLFQKYRPLTGRKLKSVPLASLLGSALLFQKQQELDICCRHRRRILPALRHRPLTDPSFPVDATNVMQVYELQEYT